MNILTKTAIATAISATLIGCGGSGSSGGSVTVAETATFKDSVTILGSVKGTGDQIYKNTPRLAFGDFNGDNFIDIVATFPGTVSANIQVGPNTKAPIKIYTSDANGTYTDVTNTIFTSSVPATALTRHISVADFNGDGADDIFLGNHGIEENCGACSDPQAYWGEEDTLILSNGAGRLTDSTNNITWTTASNKTSNWDGADGHYTHGTYVADFDGDGDMDILINVTTAFPQAPLILVNDGAGNFTEHPDANMPDYTGSAPLWSTLADVDGDTDLDLIMGGDAVYLNDGTGDFDWAGSKIALPANIQNGNVEMILPVDVNGDGNVDLLTQSYSSDPVKYAAGTTQVEVLIGNGDGTFTDETFARAKNGLDMPISGMFYAVDLNGDGREDIVGVKHTKTVPFTSTLYVYVNNAGIFEPIDTNYTQSGIAGIGMVDQNNDGDIDLFTGNDGIQFFEANKIITIQ